MSPAYDQPRRWSGHIPFDALLGAIAAGVVVAAWSAERGNARALCTVSLVAVSVAALATWKVSARAGLASLLIIVLAGVASAHAWQQASQVLVAPFHGWATVVDDPTPVQSAGPTTSQRASGARVTVDVEGRRYQVSVWGSTARRLLRLAAGEQVWVSGSREVLAGDRGRRAIVRHIVGELRIERLGDVVTGAPVARASNRVRSLLRAGAERVMEPADAALFAGLVIGDDSRQSAALVADFRAVGLSHLTAVSGQNVAFVLAVAGIGLRRITRWWRLAATLAVIAWFAVLTRLEPSVLRASAMAAMSAWSFAVGRPWGPTRSLLIAVIALVLIDPMLVWSVAFWLSSGATLGVTAIAPRIEAGLSGPSWFVAPAAVTLGAQVGVLVPSWLVFHRLPVGGVVANLLAAPVAGFVMLVGIPAGLVAGLAPHWLAAIVMTPAAAGTRWVSVTARVVARLQPMGWLSVAGWTIQAVIVAVLWQRRRTRGLP